MSQIGSIYNVFGQRVHKGKRTSSVDGDRIVDCNDDRLSKIKILKIFVKCLLKRRVLLSPYYAGPWFSQFGHFLAETISRLDTSKKLAGSQFIFHTMDMDPDFQKPLRWQLKMLSSLGISRVKVLTSQDHIAINLKILEERVTFPHAINPSAISTYNFIKSKNESSVTYKPFIFFSRSRLHNFHIRMDLNLNYQIESLFSKYDFQILHPENLPIEEQIACSSQAKIVAGVRGSALHLSLFSREQTPVLEIGDSHQTGPNPLQVAICKAKLQNLIYFQFNRQSKTHNLQVIEKKLSEMVSKMSGG